MKTVMKSIIGLLVVSVLAGLLAGCGISSIIPESSQNESTAGTVESKPQENIPKYLNLEGFPIVNEPVTLKIMVSKTPVQPNFEEILIWQEYEKMTGVKIEWDSIPQANIKENMNLALASGDLPDIFYKTSIPDGDILKYGEQGVFVKLNDLIDKYAPNYKKISDTMPDVKKSIPVYNGNIYSLPSLLDVEPAEIQRKLFINRKWLDKAGLSMPETTDELYAVLKTFKDLDANGNGENDEVPLSSPGLVYITDALIGAWGLGNRGITHPYVDFDEKAGKLRFIPADPAFKEVLEYMNKLYSEKLLDQEIFTMNSTQLFAKFEQNSVGAFSSTSPSTGSKYANDFEGLGVALKGPHGDQLWAARRSHIAARGAFAITNVNKYPEVSIRWIDYFYGNEGAKMFYMGIEGISYEKAADGKYKYLDELANNIPEGSSFSQVIAKYVPYGGGGGPTITRSSYFSGGEMEPIPLKAAENMSKFTPAEVWGPFNFTMEESEKKVALENDIISYVNQSISQFIQGRRSLTEWDSYIDQMRKMGLDEYLKIYTAGYERYEGK